MMKLYSYEKVRLNDLTETTILIFFQYVVYFSGKIQKQLTVMREYSSMYHFPFS